MMKAKQTAVRCLAVILLAALSFSTSIGCAAKVELGELTLKFGEEKLIELQNPLESPIWTSADETIATVDSNGVVKGVAPGTTDVTANIKDKPAATVTVTVNMAEMEMTVDYGTEQAIELKGNGALKWVSSDETVATVSDAGVVKGIAPGNAQITVKQGDADVAKVAVTVNVVEPTAIFLSSENIEMKIDEIAQLSYILMPENASIYGITWKSANPSIAEVDENGNIKAVSDGMTTVICSTPNGQLATCNVTVKPKSAIEQLNEAEKALFDGLINDILPSFYNASAFRIRKLYYYSSSGSNTILYVDIQGTNKLGGTLYQTGTIFKSTTADTWYYLKMDTITKDYPVPTETMDYTKINAALEEYWSGSIH